MGWLKPPTSVVCTETVGPEIADRFFFMGCCLTGSPEMEWDTGSEENSADPKEYCQMSFFDVMLPQI